MTKHVIIVRRGCHEFANKLWSDMAIHAYAFMANAKVWNFAVFESGFFAPFHTAIARLFGRSATPAQYTFLPPTVSPHGKFIHRNPIYFFGWLFRNPKGFVCYRKELLERFGPTTREEARLAKALARLPAGRILIGVHLRLKPFPYFPDGEFLIPPERVRDILNEYLREQKLASDQVALVLVADQPVPAMFRDFATHSPMHDDRTQFLLLSKCSVIIGANSTFSNLAAWFGDVPHIVTTKNPIDWEHYANQKRFFENKYATFALGVPGHE